MTLHPHNLAQKAEIIVEHFREHTAAKIGGQGEGDGRHLSRLHAVRYKLALDRYIHEQGLHGRARARRLLRHGGRRGRRVHRAAHERLPRVADRRASSATDDYQVLVVAEKFQTGFDQPLLHTMYVDKPLTGLHAVQTLSPAQPHPPARRRDTFVLDFRNDADEIQEAFEPYYGAHRRRPDRPEPALRHPPATSTPSTCCATTRSRPPSRPCSPRSATSAATPSVYALLDPAVDRFNALDEERRTSSATRSTASSTSTRSSRRSSPSPTASSSATTSTAGRSLAVPARPGGRAARPRHARSSSPTCGSSRPSRARSRSTTASGEVVDDLRRPRPAARARGEHLVTDHRGHQRAVRPRTSPTPTSCCSTSSRRAWAADPDARRPARERTPSTTSASSSTASS